MNEEMIFNAALDKPPAERAAFLDQACAGQPALREAVEALLAAHEMSDNLLDQPAVDVAATIESKGEAASDAASDFTQHADVPTPAAGPVTGMVIASRYTLQEKIGEGGMGEVWVAKQTAPVKRNVALKLIKSGMDSRAVLQRFEQERQALALMDHPNISRVLDGGLTPTGQPFFVMELVNGLPLDKFCDAAKLTLQQRLELFVPICQAVQHAHQKGIVHRDLKPSNIQVTMIDGSPVPKVIDFGVAKAIAGKLTEDTLATNFGAVVGTLEYMSPEQAGFSNDDVDTRADIYSLGVVLYELLTGLRPLDAARLRNAAFTEMVRIIREEEPSKPSTKLSTNASLPSLAALRQTEPKKLMALLRGELDWVVMKCLEKQRDRRYETANALARDVQRYLSDEPVEARPPSVGYRWRKFLKRHRGAVAAACLVLLTLIVGIVGTTWGLVRALAAEQTARAEFLAAEDARAKAAALAISEAQQREKAEQAEAETLADYRASTDEAIAQLIGSQDELGPHERLYLENTLKRWQAYANRQGDDERSRAIRAEGHSRVAYLWLRLGRPTESVQEARAASDVQEMLVNQFPSVPSYREDLGTIHNNSGEALSGLGRQAEARAEHLRAKAIFQKLTEEFPTDSRYQQFLAASHDNLGRLLVSLGDRDAAREEYEAGVKIREAMVAQFPDKPGYQHLLARIHLNLGDLLIQMALYEEAEKEYLAAQEISEKLVQQHPEVRDFQRELGKCYINFGILLVRLGKPVEALATQKSGRNILKEIAEQFPAVSKYQQHLAAAHVNVGTRLAEMSRHKESRVEFQTACEILSKLEMQFPDVPEIQHELATAHQCMGSLLLMTGEHLSAITEFESAIDANRRLVRHFPESPAYKMELGRVQNSLANALINVGRFDEAKISYEASKETLEELVARFPTVPEYQLELGGNYCNLGMLILNTTEESESLKWFDLAIETLTPIHRKEPRDANAKKFLMFSHRGRADAYDRLKRHAEAVPDWDRLIAICPPPLQMEFRVSRVFSQLQAGLVAEALVEAEEMANAPTAPPPLIYDMGCLYAVASGKKKDKQQEYSDRAMELLQQAVKAGYRNVPHMAKGPDLDPLRDREDFKMLLEELQTNGASPSPKQP